MNYLNIYNNLINKRKNNIFIKSKDVYIEKHHIIPKSIGGTDDKENLVNLTPKEHYIAHLLLCKIFENTIEKRAYNLMLYVIVRMCETNKNNIKYNSRLYHKNKINLKKTGVLTKNGRKGARIVWDKYKIHPELKIHYLNSLSNSLRSYYKEHDHIWKNRKHRCESKEKIKTKAILRNVVKDRNPMYGKIWIHNDNLKCNKIINKEDIIENEWFTGRKMSYSMFKENQMVNNI